MCAFEETSTTEKFLWNRNKTKHRQSHQCLQALSSLALLLLNSNAILPFVCHLQLTYSTTVTSIGHCFLSKSSLHPIKPLSYLNTPLHLKISLLEVPVDVFRKWDAEEWLSGISAIAAQYVVYFFFPDNVSVPFFCFSCFWFFTLRLTLCKGPEHYCYANVNKNNGWGQCPSP